MRAAWSTPASWLREGLDGLLPLGIEGADRSFRRGALGALLVAGLTAAVASVVEGTRGMVAHEFLFQASVSMAAAVLTVGTATRLPYLGALLLLLAGATTVCLALSWSVLPIGLLVAGFVAAGGLAVLWRSANLPRSGPAADAMRAILAEAAGDHVLLLDDTGVILNVVRPGEAGCAVAAGRSITEAVHLRDRVALLSALTSLRRGARRSELILRAGAELTGPVAARLRLVAMPRPGSRHGVLAILDPTGGAAAPLHVQGALRAYERECAAKRNLLASIGQELATAQSGTAGLPTPVLAGALCHLVALEAGSLTLRPEPVELEPLVTKAAGPALAEAQRRGLAFAPDIRARGAVLADGEALRHLIAVLTVFAVHATRHGGVDLVVDAGPDGLSIHMSDTSDGLVADASGQTVTPCALQLARALSTQHFGRMDMSSQPGVGTVVDIFIPVDCAERADAGCFTLKENIVSLDNARKKSPNHPVDDPQAPDRRTA
ncbi:sensor histidine kinase [Aureimonas frigidaquae]|uniref:sensor histidine kinase n=1 Tax=Aureimonas frigidaquae TaxID=424757 RepID=UPI000781DCF2|nr:HAMP domain-containing histidine kinase [Aureimonas frigidaquae]